VLVPVPKAPVPDKTLFCVTSAGKVPSTKEPSTKTSQFELAPAVPKASVLEMPAFFPDKTQARTGLPVLSSYMEVKP
jgi:hypothetical protein